MAKRGIQFQTIRTEGAILPPDILRRIASLKVDGATPDAYHLPPGSKLNEAISQSWTTLLNHWQAFQEARANLPESDETGTAVTNERWLLPLFKELDYGRLVTTKSPEIDERVYPIERFYNHTPIHLIGCKLPLDRRTRGARGAATASPHSMVQEFINRSNEHLWAFLSNGLQLRILRDNISLSRQAFVEFDLEAMMDGEVYADFALLWLLCHQSRVESDKAVDCWLEKWSHLAREQGTRVLNDLRVGVQKAIEALGRGFIGHPRNDQLREKLRTGTLTTDEYYRQLLRTVYRLLFLFVAEDRELLHPPDADAAVCNLYDTHYSTRRLRELAHKIRGSKHADLWHSLSLVFDALGRNEGCPELGLCGLGSFLWRSSSTADLLGPLQGNGEAALITNDDLLQAVRALAYVEQDRVLRIVDYRNLGSEELGSVYESLLELHPVMNAEAKVFDLSTAAGNERKTTGSYYTPDSLVQCLLDSALDPVVEDRLKGKKGEDAEQALLAMKVCDPACGSGHFLIAAAHRLARHLARVRTGETEPSPEDYQHALRDVIGRCIYGVDLNPMAVELCKVSLWMEAIEPGKPLSFLDHHIQCGNSLLGTTPALLAKGIPDDAFKPIEGDVKERVNALKKDNKRERKDYERGYRDFHVAYTLGNLPAAISQITEAGDDSLSDIAAKQQRYEELVRGADYLNARLLADIWCSPFVWHKDDSDLGRLCPTEREFRRVEASPHSINLEAKAEVGSLSTDYQFFHWHLAFPDVFHIADVGAAENMRTGWNGGFDLVLSNPPWEKVKFQEKEWFLSRIPELQDAKTAAQRKRIIERECVGDPRLRNEFERSLRQAECLGHFLRASGRFPLCGRGDINTYSVFTESMRDVIGAFGRVGCVVPSGLATDDTTKFFFQDITNSNSLVSFYDFQNTQLLFADVAPVMKFALVTLRAPQTNVADAMTFVFFAEQPSELQDKDRVFTLTASEIAAVNPNTGNCPTFRNRREAAISLHIYRRLPILMPEEGEPNWPVEYFRMFDMTNDSGRFGIRSKLEEEGFEVNGSRLVSSEEIYLPLYEAKLVQQFDHRNGTFDGLAEQAMFKTKAATLVPDVTQKQRPDFCVVPRYWVPEADVAERLGTDSHDWLLAFRDIIQPMTNARCAIFAIVPRCGMSNKLPGLRSSELSAVSFAHLLGNANSFVFDFATRQKIGGASLNLFILKQLPTLPPTAYSEFHSWLGCKLGGWVTARVVELSYTAWDLERFAFDCKYEGPPFCWDEGRRFLLRCELDAVYFHLSLGLPDKWGMNDPHLAEMFPAPRDAVEYIMETFPIVKRKDIARTVDENGENGRYITKEAVLAIYDEMAEAIRSGQPYQTRLDPPPGPPTDADGNFIPMAEWDENNWPSHIHQPRENATVVPVAASAVRLERGRAVLDILLLLEAWNQPVSTTALEPSLVLMRNDAARQTLLQGHATATQQQTLSEPPIFVRGLDGIYQGLETNGAIRRVGQSGFELANNQLLVEATDADRTRAQETIQAIATLSDLRSLSQVVAALTDERYELTV